MGSAAGGMGQPEYLTLRVVRRLLKAVVSTRRDDKEFAPALVERSGRRFEEGEPEPVSLLQRPPQPPLIAEEDHGVVLGVI
jgi:hypothetical protein